ncbi:MAG TPA: hypothetical protein PLJ12_09830 [Planctomycetota bacterium]|nr:hypothetical protein [Planctomycetota bacterium]
MLSLRKLVLLPIWLGLALVFAFSASGLAPSQPRELSRELAKALQAYLQALSSEEGPAEARAQLEPLLTAAVLKQHGELAAAVLQAQSGSGGRFKAGKILEGHLEGGSFGREGMDYAFRVPDGYGKSGEHYPLIVSLPEPDETPAQHLRQAWKLRAALDGAILFTPAMPKDATTWDQVTVRGRPGGLSHVLSGLREATERFAVDPDRIVVVGRGAGVAAAFALGKNFPDRFAGIVGRSGEPKPLGVENFENLPTLLAGGGAQAQAFFDATVAAGRKNCTLQANVDEASLWAWIAQARRNSSPAEVSVATDNTITTRGYWLRLAPIAPGARARASLDRAKNTLALSGEGVSHVFLLLNDAMLDLDKPIAVTCNGIERTVQAQRRAAVVLDSLAEGTSDGGRVYTAEIALDWTASADPEPSAELLTGQGQFQDRLKVAGQDVVALWKLYRWCREHEAPLESQILLGPAIQLDPSAAQTVLHRIIRLDPNHEGARGALGHVRYGDRWFQSQAYLDRYLWTQDEKVALAKGFLRFKDLWMHPDDRKFVSKLAEKDPESGLWLTPDDRERLRQGWVLQDATWISPEQAPNVDAGLWLVDGEFVDLAEANRRHANIDRGWDIPDAEVRLYATTDRATAQWALSEMSRALWDLRRVFGAEPQLPLRVALFRDQEQYDRFAFGDPDGRRPAAHAGRLYVVHHAYYAESAFRREGKRREFAGTGVGYWEAQTTAGNRYGVHSARLAVALSYVEGLDPSPKAVAKALTQRGSVPSPDYYAEYMAEKALPTWLRYGGAVFAERFFYDNTVDPNANDAPAGGPNWPTVWSLENLRSRGGLRPLETVFATALDPDQPEECQRQLLEAGCVVAFVLNAAPEAVTTAHQAFQKSLARGELRPSHIEALEQALRDHEVELREFASK